MLIIILPLIKLIYYRFTKFSEKLYSDNSTFGSYTTQIIIKGFVLFQWFLRSYR